MKDKLYKALLIIITILSANSCSELGKKPPEWAAAAFTPQGKYFVYVYKVFNVTFYESTGGSVTRSGSTTYYLQVLDASSGSKLLSKPIAFKNPLSLIQVEDDYVWMVERNLKNDKNPSDDVILFDLKNLSIKYQAGELSKLHPEIRIPSHSRYFAVKNQPGLVVQSSEGKHFLISPENGMFTFVSNDSLIRLDGFERNTYQLERNTDQLSIRGTPRGIIRYVDTALDLVTESKDDFLKPLLLTDVKPSGQQQKPTTIKFENSVFILEPTSIEANPVYKLYRIGLNDLQTVWSTSLHQQSTTQEGALQDKWRFHFQGHFLAISNASTLFRLDVRTGELIQELALFETGSPQKQIDHEKIR